LNKTENTYRLFSSDYKNWQTGRQSNL